MSGNYNSLNGLLKKDEVFTEKAINIFDLLKP